MRILNKKKEIEDFLRTGNCVFLGDKVAEWEAKAKDARTLGRRLAHVRAFVGVSQAEMAKRLGVALRSWQYYEQDQRLPDAEVLIALTRWGLNLDWVLLGVGPAVSDGGGHLPAHLALDAGMLMASHELAEEAIRGMWLPKNQFFKLVSMVYASLAQSVPYAEIIDFARLEALKLAGQRASEPGKQVADKAGANLSN